MLATQGKDHTDSDAARHTYFNQDKPAFPLLDLRLSQSTENISSDLMLKEQVFIGTVYQTVLLQTNVT